MSNQLTAPVHSLEEARERITALLQACGGLEMSLAEGKAREDALSKALGVLTQARDYSAHSARARTAKLELLLQQVADHLERSCPELPLVDAIRDVLQEGQAPLPAGAGKLAVWYGSMPESNGRENWTAILYRQQQGDPSPGGLSDGITIDRSEYPDRVRYEADRVRHLIGELPVAPDILEYDADKRSKAPARPWEDGAAYGAPYQGAMAGMYSWKKEALEAQNELRAVKSELSSLSERCSFAYKQRNELAVGFAKLTLQLGYAAGRGVDPAHDEEWSHVVYAELGDGRQVSWHMDPEALALLHGLPQYAKEWDTTYLTREGGWSSAIPVSRG